MSETARFRSPSVGIDDWGDVDVDDIVNDLCSDFDDFYRQKVKSIIDETIALPPNGGFKLLLMAAIVAYARTLAPRLDPLEPSTGWRRDMFHAVTEFCKVIGYPLTPGPYSAAPTPVPEDEPMLDVGEDSQVTPHAPPASLPEVPPPCGPIAPIRVSRGPRPLLQSPMPPVPGNLREVPLYLVEQQEKGRTRPSLRALGKPKGKPRAVAPPLPPRRRRMLRLRLWPHQALPRPLGQAWSSPSPTPPPPPASWPSRPHGPT